MSTGGTKKKRLMVGLALCAALAADAKTKVMLFFDTDVIDALKPHVIGTQTLYHSRHPNVAELGSFKLVPGLENMKISGKWIHPNSFKDEYLSERMRLQLWTLRIE